MLEEPTHGLMFSLVSHQPDRLLPTIRSRCRAISLTLPSKQSAMAWLSEKGVENAEGKLAYAGGAPLLVLEQTQSSEADEKRFLSIITMLSSGRKLDPSIAASNLAKLGMFEGLNLLQKWIFDLVCYKMTHQLQFYQGFQDSINKLAALADIQKVYGYQRKLDEAKKTALHPLNTELQLEALLIQYTQLFTH
jgi:DNA polymerase-3 subunit delta'